MQALLTTRRQRIQALTRPRLRHLTLMAAASALAGLSTMGAGMQSASATPLLCTTSLEAPITGPADGMGSLSRPQAPVEVSRCVPVENTMSMVERRSYTWRPPYAPGVSMLNVFTDALGISMGGVNGNRVMGFGFPDQALIWDGTAIQNTAYSLLELQSNPMPLRTADLVSVFNGSVGSDNGRRLAQPPNTEEGGMPRYYLNPPLPAAN